MYTYKVQLIDDASNEPETDSKGRTRPPLPKFDTTLNDVRCNRLRLVLLVFFFKFFVIYEANDFTY